MLVARLTLDSAGRAAHVGLLPLWEPARLSRAIRGLEGDGWAWEEERRNCRPGTLAALEMAGDGGVHVPQGREENAVQPGALALLPGQPPGRGPPFASQERESYRKLAVWSQGCCGHPWTPVKLKLLRSRREKLREPAEPGL